MNSMLEYLFDLSQNNTKEWYQSNKNRRLKAIAEFEHLIAELIEAISIFDNSVAFNDPKVLTFKQVRDTRFSHNKSPYNPAFRAHIASAGKQPIPVGYFLSIRPDNRSFLGGGLYTPMFKDATTMVRDYIVSHGEELEAIITNKAFARQFAVEGEVLKNVPKGYDPLHPQAEYLKNKSWYLEYFITDEQISDRSSFVKTAAQVFKAMKPFNDFLNQALKDFKMPGR